MTNLFSYIYFYDVFYKVEDTEILELIILFLSNGTDNIFIEINDDKRTLYWEDKTTGERRSLIITEVKLNEATNYIIEHLYNSKSLISLLNKGIKNA